MSRTTDPRPAALAVWLNGKMLEPAQATVSVLDHGLTVGDGVFETMKVVGGVPFARRRHLRRLHRSASLLGLTVDVSDDELIEATTAVCAAGGPTVARLRITVTGGLGPLGSGRDGGPATVVVVAGPGDAWPATTTVATVPWVRNERSAVTGVKSTSYAENVRALAVAHAAGASEAIMANTVGVLCEGTGSNVFVARNGELLTPSLASGCLAGITRELVLELGHGREVDDLTIEDLARADEAFLTSSTRDVHPIAAMDGRPLGAAPGPRTEAAARAFADLEARTLDP